MELIGFGLYLCDVAERSVQNGGRVYDFAEPSRRLRDLSPYDHLHRCFRYCTVHGHRNVEQCGVSKDVKELMHKLMSVELPDFEETVRRIEEEGGKAGAGKILIPSAVELVTYFL